MTFVKLMLKFMKKRKKPGTAIKFQKIKVRRLSLPHFSIYYKASVIKAVWCQCRKKNVGQGKKLEIQEIYP